MLKAGTGIGVVTAALGGWSFGRGILWASILFGSLTLWSLRQEFKAIADRRAFANRLVDAGKNSGGAGFVRPYSEAVEPEFDAVAAVLAERHLEALRITRELHSARNALFAVMTAVPGPCLVVDDKGWVARVNKTVCDMFQISASEAIGRPFLQVIRVHLIDDAVGAALQSRERAIFEVDVRITPHPTLFVAHIEPLGADEKGRSLGAVVLLTDVTQLRHLERVRKEFVANVSHELRTPITSIKGFVETLQGDDVPPEARIRFLRILKTEADRLDALVSDLLDLSLLESNSTAIHLEEIDIKEFAAGVFDLLEPQVQRKSITTRISVAPDMPRVAANPQMLEQALVNLVDNAVKYSPEGSIVAIEARRVATHHVEIAVVDNGPGIPSEHLPRLFERFYRVDKARSKSVGGTGLGLAIVRHIIQRHGGSVRAESRLGKGSRFAVTLPLKPEHVPDFAWDE